MPLVCIKNIIYIYNITIFIYYILETCRCIFGYTNKETNILDGLNHPNCYTILLNFLKVLEFVKNENDGFNILIVQESIKDMTN